MIFYFKIIKRNNKTNDSTWIQHYFEGGVQKYICVTSVRAQRAWIAAEGPIFSDFVVSESFSGVFQST